MNERRARALRRRLAHAGFAGGLATLLAACGGGGGGGSSNSGGGTPETPQPQAALQLSVLSSQPDKVTGSDALLQLEVLRSTPDATVTVVANGTDVTSAFTAAGGRLVGKVANLQAGANEVTASYGGETVKLALTAYPITGPVISGPHQAPFICNTSFNMGVTGIPALTTIPGDANCGVETRVDYFYRTTANAWVYLPDPAALTAYPANVKTITTTDGRSVPYVVRLETGTINRAIYQSALLHDVLNEPAPSPLSRPAGWNGKLYYPLGGGCQGGWFQQGTSTGGVINDGWLSKGYAVTSSTLNVMGQNCNDLLSSETIMMVKERFIENYGTPIYTVGTGGSGGSYQSNQTGDNYPGVFDGIIISQVFADVTSSTLFKQFDSRLLNNYFANGGYTVAQKQAISGYLQVANISNMSGQAGRIDPTVSFPAAVTAGVGPSFRYHPVTNRGGARASVYDATKNVYGVNGEGHSLRPIDNVGVQYGLKALLAGVITPAQFVDLNQKIGGLDLDLLPQSQRTAADLAVIERTYRSGRIVWGGGGLASMPIIDRRDYNDDATGGDIHTKIHSFSVRERLRKTNGHVDNHVILTSDGGGAGVDTTAAMDAWLTAVKNDASGRTLAQKVVANRPATLVDGCLINNTFVAETQVASGPTGCNAVYPAGTTPRMAAGGPLADDVIKCQLKPLSAADYPGITFTQAEWITLQLTFPDGVCDWSKPGVGQQPSRPWQSFGPSPTNLLFDITKQ